MGIKKLEQKINEYNSRELIRKEKIAREENEIRLRTKKCWSKEKSYLPEKRKIVSKISAWRNEFLKNKSFNDYAKNNILDIFYGKWGHKLPEPEDCGCWSRIRFEESGQLIYFYGYKYYGSQRIPEKEFANKLSYSYLNKLLNHIENGKVYDTIEKSLKSF